MLTDVAAIAFLGLLAGALTTVSGMGGGMLIVFALSWAIGPKAALVVSAPALMIGNLHRGWLYRADLDLTMVKRLLLGLVPGTLVGALLAGVMPDSVIRAVMVVAALSALARVVSRRRWTLPPSALTPAAAAVGLFSATAGGAAALLGPLLLATGLTGRRYLAVVAVGAVAMHVTRLAGYSAAGLWDSAFLPLIVGLTAFILLGNLAGDRLRHYIPARTGAALEVATPVVCALIGLI